MARHPQKTASPKPQLPAKTLILDESRIRSYQKCSEFYDFGGRVELPVKTTLLEFVYIQVILDMLRQEMFDYKFSLSRYVNKADKLFLKDFFSTEEREEYKRHTILNIDELFRTLQPGLYIPVFGPFEYPVSISNSVLNLNIAAMLATNTNDSRTKIRKRIYHAITFSPYGSSKDMENDIVQIAKILSIADSNPLHLVGGAPTVQLHIFGTKSRTEGLRYTTLNYTERTPKNAWARYLAKPVKQIEAGYHLPINPCPYACEFKDKCIVNPMRKPHG